MIRDERFLELKAAGIERAKWSVEKLQTNATSRISSLVQEKFKREDEGRKTTVVEESIIQERYTRIALEIALDAINEYLQEGR